VGEHKSGDHFMLYIKTHLSVSEPNIWFWWNYCRIPNKDLLNIEVKCQSSCIMFFPEFLVLWWAGFPVFGRSEVTLQQLVWNCGAVTNSYGGPVP